MTTFFDEARATAAETARRVRIHESAHLVLGYLEGNPPEAIVTFGDSGETRAYWRDTSAIVDRAGEAAELVFDCPSAGVGSDPDRRQALLAAGSQAASDAALQQAIALCREYRREIDILAGELEEASGRLAGPEVRRALGRAFADRTIASREAFEVLSYEYPDLDPATELWPAARTKADRQMAALAARTDPAAVAPVVVYVAGVAVPWDPTREVNPASRYRAEVRARVREAARGREAGRDRGVPPDRPRRVGRWPIEIIQSAGE